MATDLVQIVRDTFGRPMNIYTKKGVALNLACTGTDEAVTELIRIANGGSYTPEQWGRKHWYSLSESLLSEKRWEYNSHEQLVAIEALGETRSKRALDYLTKFAE